VARVLGVDGCKGGWVVVALEDGQLDGCRFVESIADLVDDPAVVIAVDIPLGETDPSERAADRAARAYISPRTSTVFSTPPLAALDTATYADAGALARKLTGKGISKQAWNLGPKMLDARTHWCADPWRFREVHPECSFRAMGGATLSSKKQWVGLRDRLALLRRAGIDLIEDVHTLPDVARADDVVDAAATAWTAHRIASGDATSLPDPPERDADGRPVAVWV
jgi:predicted RNase H-like nuclease